MAGSSFKVNIPSDNNKIDKSAMSNSIPMLDDSERIATSHAVYTGDSDLLHS